MHLGEDWQMDQMDYTQVLSRTGLSLLGFVSALTGWVEAPLETVRKK